MRWCFFDRWVPCFFFLSLFKLIASCAEIPYHRYNMISSFMMCDQKLTLMPIIILVKKICRLQFCWCFVMMLLSPKCRYIFLFHSFCFWKSFVVCYMWELIELNLLFVRAHVSIVTKPTCVRFFFITLDWKLKVCLCDVFFWALDLELKLCLCEVSSKTIILEGICVLLSSRLSDWCSVFVKFVWKHSKFESFQLKGIFTFLLSKFYNLIGSMCISIIKIITSKLYLRAVILEGV